MHSKIDLPEFAIEWAKRLGCSLDSLMPLRGGINSLVYQCGTATTSFVVKTYAKNSVSDHDRFTSEVQFLAYAHTVAEDFVPRLLQADALSRSVVLEYVRGDAYEEGSSPNAREISNALDFMRALNRDRLAARTAISVRAADGFLRLTEHLENIELRIRQLAFEHLPKSLEDSARSLIAQLRAKHQKLLDHTSGGMLSGKVMDAIPTHQACLSPSDFGFHNAIRTSKGVRFIDFEFAGWDDPSKAVVDFDLQPRVPVSPKVGCLRQAISWWSPHFDARMTVLPPILKLKWACIVARPLVPERFTRLAADQTTSSLEERIRAKMGLARNYLH